LTSDCVLTQLVPTTERFGSLKTSISYNNYHWRAR